MTEAEITEIYLLKAEESLAGAESEFVNTRSLILRQMADYEPRQVTQVQANRAVRRTRTFIEAVGEKGGSRL